MSTFETFGLNTEILKAISELGFETPTAIQEKTIPHLLQSKQDLIALAQTGTGKTAAFGLPIIQQTDLISPKTQTLVLCPTRELCIQITSDFAKYAKYMTNLNIVSVYGGASSENQIRALDRGAQIVVGTPGRVMDLMNRKKLKIKNIKWLVLDEADEMLNMGFKDDIDTILSETPQERQTLLFSATMPHEVARIAENFMNEPIEITAGKRNIGAENIEHIYYTVNERDRYLALKRIADINPNIYGIVFCRTKMETKQVADNLIGDGYNADALHGDLSQAQRDYVMNRFRSTHLQLLVATDVAARGLDVNDISHIINYNLPSDSEIYIHRSGRTARAGKSGVSISIVTPNEIGRIREIERLISKKMEKKPVPIGRDICEKQLFNMIDKIENVVVDNSQIEKYLPPIYEKLETLSREDLIKHFVSAEFNRFLEYYKNAPDINVKERPVRDFDRQSSGFDKRFDRNSDRSSDRGSDRNSDKNLERKDRSYDRNSDRNSDRNTDRNTDRNSDRNESKRSGVHFQKFFISIGSKDNLTKSELIELLNRQPEMRRVEIGKIEILRNFSFFEIDRDFERVAVNSLKNIKYKGEDVVVEKKNDLESEPKKSYKHHKTHNHFKPDF